jgi:ATP-dependent Clp protease ATP-binding subunit ClpC
LGLGHDFVGTEHVLLGLLQTAGGALAQTLQVNTETVRAEVHRLISALPPHSASTEPPLTPRARKALQLAGREAVLPKRSRIGIEHILLGLLHEGGGVAAIALRNLGIRLDQVRTDIPRD